jgi:hypothetical protein
MGKGAGQMRIVDDSDVSAMREAVLNAFCTLLHAGKLEPMAVLGLAAMAVGSVYREVAEAHEHEDGCPCGWMPSEMSDVATLQAALAAAAGDCSAKELFHMPVLGNA